MSNAHHSPALNAAAGGTEDSALVLHLPEGSGRFSPQALQIVRDGFHDAVRLVTPVLAVSGVDVAGIDAPRLIIPGWGCGGTMHGPHSILLALDPEDDCLSVDHVRATLVHELHHIARERGPGCGTSLRERIVCEGLAMLFEEQILGSASEFAHQHISDADIALGVAHLDEDPADEARWFFGDGDVPLWFGYTLGYRWAKTYAASTNSQASDLAHTPSTEIMSFA